jgi:signal transduction histidine kinase
VDSDPKIVREMFKNYLSNAIKYTPQWGEVEVRISFSDSRSIQVLVIDQGIGVPAKQQQSLFQKFFRADNAQSSEIEGTGLGLYYVKKCADLVGAALGFKSIEGEGSNFWFNLPLEFNSQIVS